MPGPMMNEAGKAAFMLQKEAGVTPKENARMAYDHKIPYWIPNIFRSEEHTSELQSRI